MPKENLISKEYEMAYDNYKLTFQHSMDVIKFYVTIISIFLVGFALKNEGFRSNDIFGVWLTVFVLTILILCGFLCLMLQYRIVRKRTLCIKRLNFLRKELFKDVDNDFYVAYISVSGYSNVIDGKRKYFYGISDFVPFAFIGIITLSFIGALSFVTIFQ